MIVTLFDFETNGTYFSSSVLEAMFIKIEIDAGNITEIDRFHRFYLLNDGEDFDFQAYGVHGLTIEKIKELRNNASYAKTWNEDKQSEDFQSFIKDTDLLVAHNIDFDSKFLPNITTDRFCTMKDTKQIIKALNVKGKVKNPSLKEACEFYGIDFDTTKAHGAEYDTEKLTELFINIYKSGDISIFKELSVKKDHVIIKTKAGLRQKYVKEKSINIDGISFVFTDAPIEGFKVSILRVYEKKTGNLFYAFPGFNLKNLDNKATKKIEEVLRGMVTDDVRKKIASSDLKVTSQPNLFDF